MTLDTIEDVLSHYGVKGMHWGQRKRDPSSVKPASEDAANAAKAKEVIKSTPGRGAAKTTAPLSNKELQALVTRMNLEQQYDRLSAGEARSAQNPARAFVAKLLGDVGKQEANKIAKTALTDQLQSALDKKKT